MSGSVDERVGRNGGDRDVELARLLQLGGQRLAVPPDRADRVRHAVLAECRSVARARRRRTAMGVAAGLAAAAAVAVAVRLNVSPTRPLPPPQHVATVERAVGADARRMTSEGPDSLKAQDAVLVGDELELGAGSRLTLTREHTSIRLDERTRLRLVTRSTVELHAGAIYVDHTGDASGLEIRTSFGTVRDVGTQFEVRLDAERLRVRVRSGEVELDRGSDRISAMSGTELVATSTATTRESVPIYGADWGWTSTLAPPLAVEGQRLGVVLSTLSRERGWRLAYEPPMLEADAAAIVLHGAVDGLDDDEMLSVVMQTSGLAFGLDRGVLTIRRP